MKFSDEQLSRIITAHENNELVRSGYTGIGYPCCINQAAYEEYFCGIAYDLDSVVAEWFDENYQTTWTTEQFIRKLEQKGFA